MKIRKAEIKDITEIQKLNSLLLKKEKEEYYYKTLDIGWPETKSGKNYLLKFINSNKYFMIVAENNKKIIGYLYGKIIKNKPKVADLESFFIIDKYRNKGIGQKLYSKFETECLEEKVKILRLEVSTLNKKGINFYKKQKYIERTKKMEKEF